MTLLELTTAMVLAIVVGSLAAGAALATLRHARSCGQMQCAVITAENVLESCLALPDEQWNEESVNSITQRYRLECNLPEPQISARIISLDELSSTGPVRIAVQVSWKGNRDGVRLVGFRFPAPEVIGP